MALRRSPLGQRLRDALADPVRQLQLSLLILFLLVAVGTVGYAVLEGATWLNALYMTVITVSTVGYGEIVDLSPAGRAFTMTLIVLGVGVGAWAASNAVEVMLGQTLWSSVQRRKMRDKVAGLRDHYIVCGYGRLGGRIVHDLLARGEAFVVIDWAAEVEERLLEERIPFVRGDATRDEVLLAAQIQHARGLVSALDTDANNVLAVLTARGLNPKLLVVARANSESSEQKLFRAGANRVVTPESIGGHRLALALLRPSVHDFLSRIFSFHAEVQIDVGQVTIPPNSPFAGQTIAGCDLRRIRNISILAIALPGGEFVLNPDADRKIEPGEILIVIGPAEAVYELEAMYSYTDA